MSEIEEKRIVPKYKLKEGPNNIWAIELLESKFAGVLYSYGAIKFMGEDEEGNGIMHFEYDIIDPGPFISKEEISGKEADEIMGQVLQDLIYETLKAREEARKNGNVDNRENDSEEPDSQ